MFRRLLLASCLLLSPALALAQRRPAPPPAPAAVYATPAAAAPGRTTEVTFHALNGAEFGDAAGVWTSFAANAVRSAAAGKGGRDSRSVTYRLTVPADVPVGIGAVRVATTGGVSSLALVMIDDLPSV